MSETCWAHKKWNKIESDIKLVFHSSTIESTLYDRIMPKRVVAVQYVIYDLVVSDGTQSACLFTRPVTLSSSDSEISD